MIVVPGKCKLFTLQVKPAGWEPREELLLHFESKGSQNSLLTVKAFNWLDEAHPFYREQSALLRF